MSISNNQLQASDQVEISSLTITFRRLESNELMLPDSERITWLASYPKSGNTWIRCLIQAYRSNGYLDINDLNTVAGDSAACHTHAVSATAIEDLGLRGQWLLRPAALVNAVMAKATPRIFKTHYANLTVSGLPAFIPPELTQRAIYVLRDPRSVALSMSQYYNLSMPKIVEQMDNIDFMIGFDPNLKRVVQIPQENIVMVQPRKVVGFSDGLPGSCGQIRRPDRRPACSDQGDY